MARDRIPSMSERYDLSSFSGVADFKNRAPDWAARAIVQGPEVASNHTKRAVCPFTGTGFALTAYSALRANAINRLLNSGPARPAPVKNPGAPGTSHHAIQRSRQTRAPVPLGQ